MSIVNSLKGLAALGDTDDIALEYEEEASPPPPLPLPLPAPPEPPPTIAPLAPPSPAAPDGLNNSSDGSNYTMSNIITKIMPVLSTIYTEPPFDADIVF